MRPNSRQSGFTLLEMLVALSLGLTVLGITVGVFLVLTATGSTTSTALQVQQGGRATVEALANELRTARSSSIVLSEHNGATRLVYSRAIGDQVGRTVWSEAVEYRYEPDAVDYDRNGVLDEGVLVRRTGGVETPVCRFVKQGGFEVTMSDGTVTVRLDLVAADADGRPLTSRFESTITPRN